MSRSGRIGVDLGGTKIEAVAMVDGEIVERERVATPQGDYEGTIAAIRDLVAGVGRLCATDTRPCATRPRGKNDCLPVP